MSICLSHRLAGHQFSLTNVDDIATVLYIELGLPINGDPNAVQKLPAKGHSKRRGKKNAVGGTGKEILEKLSIFHPLPAVLLEWRRLSMALTKSLLTLQVKHCINTEY